MAINRNLTDVIRKNWEKTCANFYGEVLDVRRREFR